MRSLDLCMEVTVLPAGDVRVSVHWDKNFFSIPVDNRVYMLGQVIRILSTSMQLELSNDIASVSELEINPGVGQVKVHLPIEGDRSSSDQATLSLTGCFETGQQHSKAIALSVCIQYLTKLGIAWVNKSESSAA